MLSVNEDHTIIKLSGHLDPEYYRASIPQPLKYINMLSQNHVSRLDSGLEVWKKSPVWNVTKSTRRSRQCGKVTV